MRQVYTATELLLDSPSAITPIRLGVIGNPIAHSKSPQMQQAALQEDGRSLSYVRLLADLDEGGFESLLDTLESLQFIGANVTVPFKKKAFSLASQTDALSQLCGASNTLVRQENGWHAYNTDGPGFERAIQELCGKSLSELRIVILGACGGAGSALSCQCVLSGCRHLTLVNRPRPELPALQDKLSRQSTGVVIAHAFTDPELEELVQQAHLIVNATSLGLREGDPLPLPIDWLQPGHLVYDIVTHDTPLRRAAAKRGCTTDNGLGMLLWQGAIAYQHWFGKLPNINAMREALIKA